MSVNLQTENIKLSEAICTQYNRITTDCDVIVPDIKPDVLKVLQVSSEATITEKIIHLDKVHLSGIIRIDILYIPDGDVIGNIKSISTTHEFSHIADATGAKPGMNIVAELDCETPEHTLINSRKLSIRNNVGINLKVSAENEIHIATGAEDETSIRTKCEHLKICNTRCDTDKEFIVRERLDVPSGNPDLGEILKFCAKPISEEMRILDNKVIVKGEIHASTLYCGEDEDNTVQCMEHTIPFTEILDIDGINDNMTGEIDYSVKDVMYEICRDSDGDKRILSVEITLCASIRATEIIECDAICDAYGINHELISEKSEYTVEKLLDTVSTRITDKEIIAVPDYLPEINRVFDCSAVPNIESIVTESNNATVSGYLTCNILYMSADRETPVSGFTHVLPFSHTFDIPGINEQSICEAKADVEHLSYTISDARNMEVRSNLIINLKAVNPEKCEFISNIEFDEDTATPHIPSMIVYFIRPGDTLWEISKRYRTTTEEILKNNNVDPDNLQIGSPIYIFR